MSACRPDEWVDIVDWIVDRWPRSREWATPKPKTGEPAPPSRAEVLYPDFERIPAKAIWQAARVWYDEGKGRPPHADELRAAAKTAAKKNIPDDVDPTDPTWCPHIWQPWPAEGGYQTRICVKCGTEQTVVLDQASPESEDETVDVF